MLMILEVGEMIGRSRYGGYSWRCNMRDVDVEFDSLMQSNCLVMSTYLQGFDLC